jgi:hypothetical protein
MTLVPKRDGDVIEVDGERGSLGHGGKFWTREL